MVKFLLVLCFVKGFRLYGVFFLEKYVSEFLRMERESWSCEGFREMSLWGKLEVMEFRDLRIKERCVKRLKFVEVGG